MPDRYPEPRPTELNPNPRQRVAPPPPQAPPATAAAAPDPTSWPASRDSEARLTERLMRTIPASASKSEISGRRGALRMVTGWLAEFPGASWQERWLASGIVDRDDWDQQIVSWYNTRHRTQYLAPHARRGMAWLLALDAVRPSYEWMHRHHERMQGVRRAVFDTRDPIAAARLNAALEAHGKLNSRIAAQKASALAQIARILVRTGKQQVADITIDELLEVRSTAKGIRNNLPSGAAYNAMAWAGFLPDDAPATFTKTRRSTQRTVDELVDRTGIQNQRMRNLFVDYLRARAAALDYVSLQGLAGTLVRNFWCDLERLEPGVDTLDLPAELFARWKESQRTIRYGTKRGRPRTDLGPILLVVRAFYYDLADWAQIDPDRYAGFAAPNPITQADIDGFRKSVRHQRAKSHARTRERLPLLPKLLDTIAATKRWHTAVLEHTRTHQIGQRFTVEGIELARVGAESRAFGGRLLNGVKRAGGLPVRRYDTGELFDAVHAEGTHFWRWAAINVLAETGIRIEELEELTHTALVQYRLPSTGELLPLLQIAPSKTDEERVIPVSPELASVLAEIIGRIRRETGAERLPLLRRWDQAEKRESEPMPFLFQRVFDGERRTINRAWILRHLAKATHDAGFIGDDGEPIVFQNHDLRRMFATDAVKSGLPIHIAAALLGHQDLNTTQRYAAIYEEDVYEHHRSFIDARRALRPAEEYRPPSPEEWEEFLGHYQQRQTEFGLCGRAYGSSCVHDGACLRCALLRPDPKQEGRLLERIANTEARIQEAETQGWLTDLEFLKQTLAGAHRKLDGMRQQLADGATWLGLPTIRPPDVMP
ncbi:site-specific integrase [Agromyces mediolanus]|uniref:Integrase n=1 Tax=Agromyces mediolanus TaxID=41986 RepID=A0A918CD36_AGRME|nr:site-specific integrase [Agromyces mediolanus]GGR16658.1 integrase [Agromyces mediolanus]GLJ73660.1 integrase [Agromyces mediolanus]